MNSSLEKYLKKVLGPELNDFVNAGEEPAAIRVNPIKSSPEKLAKFMIQKDVPYAPHGINPCGFVLKNDPVPLSHTLPFFMGDFFYQGFSSQLPVLALDPRPGEKVLDMAAAPGSKSTQIAGAMKNRGVLILNDVSRHRQQPLLTNLYRAGVYNDILLQFPGQRIGKIFPEYFDKVLVDAPCSGLGRMPTSEFYLDREYPDSLENLLNTQYHLLVSAIKATRPGGTIVYSTCSVTPDENEAIIERILREYPVELMPIDGWVHPNLRSGYPEFVGVGKQSIRVFPSPQPFEGFFITKLRKIGATPERPARKEISFFEPATAGHPDVAPVLDWISNRWQISADFFDRFSYYLTRKKLWIISRDQKRLPTKGMVKAGLPFAENRGREWKLTNASVQLFGEFIDAPPIEMDDSTLISLFREGKIEFPSQVNGYFILKREKRKLGIVSIVDNKLKIHLPHRFDLVL